MPPMIEVRNLCKTYGRVVAADDISFQARRGEIFGLLGPNGAGKTTTLECLEGIRQPDRGDLAVLGVNPTRQPGKLRRLIGVQLQSGGLPDAMTVDEALRFFAAYHGVAPRHDLLDRLGLGDKLTFRIIEDQEDPYENQGNPPFINYGQIGNPRQVTSKNHHRSA